ncbi:hypothetical protein R1flu_000252 [Riccia fluitans]|uniref:F-box domain-containing protein n=1 Tax=Riccia fluitans TaxID=41844 RepID=A0ABD1Y2W7_9MARC
MVNGVLIRGFECVRHKSWYRLLRLELLRRRNLRHGQQRDSGDEDDSGMILPMDLMERILARVPFPDVFRTRALSRSWRRKFSRASKRGKPPCTLLNELNSAAVTWPQYCPVYMTPGGDLMGYNHSLSNWEKIVISAYSPMKRNHSNLVAGRGIDFSGPLMCVHETQFPFFSHGDSLFEIFVANIQTGSWKSLLCPKHPEASADPQVMLINDPGSEDYKILVCDRKGSKYLDRVGGFELEVCLFDSTSGTWRTMVSQFIQAGNCISSYCARSPRVDPGGNIYLMASSAMDLAPGYLVHVLRYSMEHDAWSMSSPLLQPRYPHEQNFGGMFRCGSKLMLVTLVTNAPVRSTERDNVDYRTERGKSYKLGACVYQVCPDTLQIEAVSASPASGFSGICRRMMSDDDNIYFFCSNCVGRTKSIVVRYNVSGQKWDSLPPPPTEMCRDTVWARSPYVPGQNPFCPV